MLPVRPERKLGTFRFQGSCLHFMRPRAHGTRATGPDSSRELEALEPMQRLLDLGPARRAWPLAEPGPFLDQKLATLTIRLEIENRGDVVADENRLREVAERPFFLWQISLEV